MEMETTNDAGDSHHIFDGTIVTHCNIVDQSSDSSCNQGQQEQRRNHDLQEEQGQHRRDFHDLVLISSPTATSPETQQTAIEVSTMEEGGEQGLPSTVSATEFTTNSPSAGATMKSSMAPYHHHHIEFITPAPPLPSCWGKTRSNPKLVHQDSRETVSMDAATISTPPPLSSFTKRNKGGQSSSIVTPMVITPLDIDNNHFEDEMVENQGGGCAEPRRASCPCGTCSVGVVEETDDDPPKPPPLEYIFVPTLEPTTDTAMSQNINISSRPSSSMYPRFSSLSHWTVQQQQQQKQQQQEQPRHYTTPSWHYKQQDQGLRMTRTTTTAPPPTTTTTTLEDEKIMTTIDDTWKASKWAIHALGFNHTCHHGAESLIFSSDASEEQEEEEEHYDEDDHLDGIKYLSFAYI